MSSPFSCKLSPLLSPSWKITPCNNDDNLISSNITKLRLPQKREFLGPEHFHTHRGFQPRTQ